jgi:hypothetical protein
MEMFIMNALANIDVINKMIHINIEGFSTLEGTIEAVDRLEAKVNTMKDVSEWTILIGCEKMATFQNEILPLLERCYTNIYMKFKHAVLVNPTHPVARMQLQRIARTTGFKGKFVSTEAEALQICNS